MKYAEKGFQGGVKGASEELEESLKVLEGASKGVEASKRLEKGLKGG